MFSPDIFSYDGEQEEQYLIEQGVCPSCRGSGQMIDPDSFSGMEDCWMCNGTGKYNES